MKEILRRYFHSFLHILFPHNCANCSADLLQEDSVLCSRCFTLLPDTGFFDVANNPVEKRFYGRVKIEAAAAGFYFNKHSIIQLLIAQLKYHGDLKSGKFLGRQIGIQLINSGRFDNVQAIVPVPLNAIKEKKRGYNQSFIIAQGIAQEFNRPILNDLLIRSVNTETQTKKNRISRFKNMQGVFEIDEYNLKSFRHILLIDDVITTGATLESCSATLLLVPGMKISIATVAFA